VSTVVVAADRLVTGSGAEPAPGWVEVRDGLLARVGDGAPPRPADVTAAVLTPGFVDVHCHGGGGAAFGAGGDSAALAADTHRRHGTTTVVASLVTEPLDVLEEQLRTLRPLVERGDLAGIHLEGPWLSPRRCGAHDPAVLRPPYLPDVRRLLAAGGGAVRVVTIAPELDGALDAVTAVAESGAVAAVGHTDATYEQASAAVVAGARLATHLFNAMSPLSHRAPGAAGAMLDDVRVSVELVADGHHLHPAVLGIAARSAGPDRTVLVTDAMAAAGQGDGRYTLGGLSVEVVDGVARVESGSIAGSTLTTDAALRHAVGAGGLSLAHAVRALTANPARVLGRGDIGLLEVGRRADLVLLDESLAVERVCSGGDWVS
jgi:N-acetylglucosamine-6-phosphate deacetylase